MAPPFKPNAPPPVKPAGKNPTPPAPPPPKPQQPKMAPKKKLTDHERLNRVIKVTQVTALIQQMHTDVQDKVTDLQTAAESLGNAYSTAMTNHRDAVNKQQQLDALETQLVFSILTVLTSGALSWATEMVRIGNTARAASRAAAIDEMVQHANLVGAPGIIASVKYQAQNLRDVLAKQVSKREVMTTVVSDTLVAIAGEAFASMGPYLTGPNSGKPPAVDQPVSIEPDYYRGDLKKQIGYDAVPALHALKDLAEKVKNLADKIDDPDVPWELWDKVDTTEAKKAYAKFKSATDELADTNDLPSDKQLTDELERYIWALWVPCLHTKRKGFRVHDKNDAPTVRGKTEPIEWDEYERVRKPVDDRLVALGIETEDETNDNRETEDKRLITWAEKYLRNVKPWVSGKKS